eukprot:gene10780-13201_t
MSNPYYGGGLGGRIINRWSGAIFCTDKVTSFDYGNSYKNVKQVFAVSLSFLTIAAAVGVVDDSFTTDYGSRYKNVKSVFSISLAFLTLGAAANVCTIILQIIAMITHNKKIRIAAGFGSAITTLMFVISFFVFMKINTAFGDDNECPNPNNINAASRDNNICKKFKGSSNILNMSWSPEIGWYFLVGSILLSFCSSVVTFSKH